MMNRNSGKPENPTKGTLVDAAYRRLKAAILSNELLPGFQATEPEMAALMEMSRTPVREALIRLQGEGLVDLVPDVVTMNNAHETHWTALPDPAIPHVLRGWARDGRAPPGPWAPARPR